MSTNIKIDLSSMRQKRMEDTGTANPQKGEEKKAKEEKKTSSLPKISINHMKQERCEGNSSLCDTPKKETSHDVIPLSQSDENTQPETETPKISLGISTKKPSSSEIQEHTKKQEEVTQSTEEKDTPVMEKGKREEEKSIEKEELINPKEENIQKAKLQAQEKEIILGTPQKRENVPGTKNIEQNDQQGENTQKDEIITIEQIEKKEEEENGIPLEDTVLLKKPEGMFQNYTSDFTQQEGVILAKIKKLKNIPKTRLWLVFGLIGITIFTIVLLFTLDPKKNNLSYYKAALFGSNLQQIEENTDTTKETTNTDTQNQNTTQTENQNQQSEIWNTEYILGIAVETKASEDGKKIYKYNNNEYQTLESLQGVLNSSLEEQRKTKVENFLLKR